MPFIHAQHCYQALCCVAFRCLLRPMCVFSHIYSDFLLLFRYTPFSKNIHKPRAEIENEAKVGKQNVSVSTGRTGPRQTLLCTIMHWKWEIKSRVIISQNTKSIRNEASMDPSHQKRSRSSFYRE